MLTVQYILILLLCTALYSCGKPTAIDTYTDITGHSGTFSDHHGQWMVINYWAIWCKPCVTEIPELNEFASSNSKEVTVFSVNYDGVQGEQLLEQSNKLGIEFATLTADPAPVLGFERPTVLPTTLVFNPSGTLHRILVGPQTTQSLQQALQ